MNQLLLDYLPLAVFIGVALVIGLALMVAPFLVAVRNPDPEKVSAYECGFNAFDDARMKFDVRFYLVSILFIIFDLEVAFLFPWAVAFKEVGAVRLLVDDGVPGRADHRLHLRVEQGRAGMGLMTAAVGKPTAPASGRLGEAGRSLLHRGLQRARRQGLPGHHHRRPDQLGAHRLADVDDVRAGLLRGGDDAGLHAALRPGALRLRAARLARASPT